MCSAMMERVLEGSSGVRDGSSFNHASSTLLHHSMMHNLLDVLCAVCKVHWVRYLVYCVSCVLFQILRRLHVQCRVYCRHMHRVQSIV